MFNSNFIQCIVYQLLFLLSMIQYRYLCRIFERKCSFDDVFSLFEVDQVNVKYVSRTTQSRFFVNYVTNTNQIDKNRMQYQGLDNDRAKHVSNSALCENKSYLHQQNPQWWCFLCPLPPFCFAQKIHCIWSGSYSVYYINIYGKIHQNTKSSIIPENLLKSMSKLIKKKSWLICRRGG